MSSDGRADLGSFNCTDNVAGVGGGCLYSAGRAIVQDATLMRGNEAENGGCLCEPDGSGVTSGSSTMGHCAEDESSLAVTGGGGSNVVHFVPPLDLRGC